MKVDKFKTVGGFIAPTVVEDMVRICMKHLSKKEYELNIKAKDIKYAVACTRVVNNKGGRATYGGKDVIQINLSLWQFTKGPNLITEYKSYNNDKLIGEIQTYNYLQQLLVIVGHEVAHHVQHKQAPYIKRFRNTWRKAHGQCFKDIYCYLRVGLINKLCIKACGECNAVEDLIKWDEGNRSNLIGYLGYPCHQHYVSELKVATKEEPTHYNQ